MSEQVKSDLSRVLYYAAWTGNLNKVKDLLASHTPISFVNPAGNSPLHIAFIYKQDAIVDLLLEAIYATSKFDNLQNSSGLTHMHVACTRKNKQVVQGFLDAGVKIRATVDESSPIWPGYNALHFAASHQSLEAVKVLLEAGLDHHTQTSTGKTALDLIYESLTEALIIVDLLEQKEDSRHKRNFSNFQIACLNEDTSVVQKFIEHGAADKDSMINRELSIASCSSPLHCAVASNSKETVELLLQNGAKVECKNFKNMTPLHAALYCGESMIFCDSGEVRDYDVKIFELLYAAVEDKMISHEDSNGLSYFHAAIASNDLPTVKKYLVEGKADVNKSLSSSAGEFADYTPLHMAVHFGRPEIAEFLIERGADLNACDKKYGTPLHMAFTCGHQSFIELFFINGAKLDIVTPKEKRTMLHLVVCFINLRINLDKHSVFMYIEQIVKLGVDVNAKDAEGNTALHFFHRRSSHWATYFQMLLDLGADINVRNDKGKLPFDSSNWLFRHLKYKANAIFFHHVQKLKTLGLKVDPENDETCRLISLLKIAR